jgi:hypothetical protein
MKRIILLLVFVFVIAPISAQDDDLALPFEVITTAHRQDGNRVIVGRGQFPTVRQFDIPVDALPTWLVGAGVDQDALWLLADDGGVLRGILPGMENDYTITDPLVSPLQPGMPPVMIGDGQGYFIDQRYPVNMAALTHTARMPERTAYIRDDGALLLLDGANVPMNEYRAFAAPDMRIVVNGLGQAAAYVNATNERYIHAIMGDDLEGASLVVMDMGFGEIVSRFDLPGEQVFEGLSPMWADVNADGTPDLIVTASDGNIGAQIRVYDVDGTQIAIGPPIGRGNRWRHQLAWGAFGPDGENLLAEVLTPHIGGIVGFFRYENGALERVARLDGYTSHIIYSRNLDMAVGGDFNGDGQMELVLPSQSLDRIAGLQINADYAVDVVWELPLDGQLTTNLSAVTLADGGLALAAGVVDDSGAAKVRVWVP